MEHLSDLSEPQRPLTRSASDSSRGPVRYVVGDACTACGACLLTCPEHAFVPTVPLTVDDRCTDCGECVEICPADAIERVPA